MGEGVKHFTSRTFTRGDGQVVLDSIEESEVAHAVHKALTRLAGDGPQFLLVNIVPDTHGEHSRVLLV